MKNDTLIANAVSAFNAEVKVGADRFNAWKAAWEGKRNSMTPAAFIKAMLDEFKRNPLAMVSEGAKPDAVKKAHEKRAKVLHVQLLRDMPKIDPTVKWTSTNKKGRVSEMEKAGVDAALLKAVAAQVAKTPNITPAQIAVILAKLGVKA